MRRHAADTTATSGIPPKRRLALVAGTNVNTKHILDMPDADINYNFLLEHQIPVVNIRVGGLTPTLLHARGATDAKALQALGFDSLHLLNTDFLNDAVATYGSGDLVATFLKSPHDAVALADTVVMQTLSLTIGRLMEECAGSPSEAVAVLKQLNTIVDLPITILLDTGIRGPQLTVLGYTYQEVQTATGANNRQMAKLLMNQPR